ncbi:MAG: hypothetical protein PHP52_00325 [Bacteroidales bacterium]|jgi:hypothetical protein|nr:hypothetical protein [Bacteroidales bacterium]MDD4216701.1 hypothetical protein [Bacteroidales bacterium]MDY0141119.1 hypothetical protein [Bacteroidales bacterium]
MKTNIYLFIIIAVFLSCKGGNQKNNSTETLGSVEQENEIGEETNDAKAVNIKDLFLLLPNDAFPIEEISTDNRKLLLNNIGKEKAFDIASTPIDVCDVQNRFLDLTGMQYGWEMCYWNLEDTRKLVAINNMTESGSKIRIFFYENGKLTEDFDYQLGGNQNYSLTDFVDISQLSPDTQKFAKQQFTKGAYNLYYKLPQNGTSLKVSIDTYQLMNYDETYEIPYEATKEVSLNWKNEKWEK